VRLYKNGSRFIFEVDGEVYVDVNDMPAGPGKYLGLGPIYITQDLYIKDLLITPASLSTIRDMVTVDVGNHRFLCEHIKKCTIDDLSLVYGTDPPTNIGTDEEPIVDMYAAGANKSSGAMVQGLLNDYKFSDNLIVTAEIRQMPDHDSTDPLGLYLIMLRNDAGNRFIYWYMRTNLGTGTCGITGWNPTIGPQSTSDPGIIGSTDRYFTAKAAKYMSKGMMEWLDASWELEQPNITSRQTQVDDDFEPYFLTYTDNVATQVAHQRIKNINVYRILGELS